MILIGHPFIESEHFSKADSIETVANTPSNSTLFMHYNASVIPLCKHCVVNGLKVAIQVDSITEAILANALKVHYIVCEKSLAPEIQKLAENYMFDPKILCIIAAESDIEWCALNEIDGVIFKEVIDGIS